MPLFPLTILLEVDDLDRRFEIEATQTAGDAMLAYMHAHAALYGAADGLYPGVATIRINMTDRRVTYGWRTRTAFLHELEAARYQAAQVVAALSSAIGNINVPTVLAPADSAPEQRMRDQTLRAGLLGRGIYCPEGARQLQARRTARLIGSTRSSEAFRCSRNRRVARATARPLAPQCGAVGAVLGAWV